MKWIYLHWYVREIKFLILFVYWFVFSICDNHWSSRSNHTDILYVNYILEILEILWMVIFKITVRKEDGSWKSAFSYWSQWWGWYGFQYCGLRFSVMLRKHEKPVRYCFSAKPIIWQRVSLLLERSHPMVKILTAFLYLRVWVCVTWLYPEHPRLKRMCSIPACPSHTDVRLECGSTAV